MAQSQTKQKNTNDAAFENEALNNCPASCKSCSGKCTQDSQHSGQHKCGKGHTW